MLDTLLTILVAVWFCSTAIMASICAELITKSKTRRVGRLLLILVLLVFATSVSSTILVQHFGVTGDYQDSCKLEK